MRLLILWIDSGRAALAVAAEIVVGSPLLKRWVGLERQGLGEPPQGPLERMGTGLMDRLRKANCDLFPHFRDTEPVVIMVVSGGNRGWLHRILRSSTRHALELTRPRDEPITVIARDLQISESSLCQWMPQGDLAAATSRARRPTSVPNWSGAPGGPSQGDGVMI